MLGRAHSAEHQHLGRADSPTCQENLGGGRAYEENKKKARTKIEHALWVGVKIQLVHSKSQTQPCRLRGTKELKEGYATVNSCTMVL